jgi:hypothetical protein
LGFEARAEDFVFVDSEPDSRHQVKSLWGQNPTPEERELRAEEVNRRPIRDNIRAVAQAVSRQVLKDSDHIYFVVELEPSVSPARFGKLVEYFRGNAHGYLDYHHDKVLVSVEESWLERYSDRELPFRQKEPILSIRQLTNEERLSAKLRETLGPNRVKAILHVMPTQSLNLTDSYLDQVTEFLEATGAEATRIAQPQYGMLRVILTGEIGRRLLRDANLVFRIHQVSRAKAIRQRQRRRTSASVSSLAQVSPPSRSRDLANVCVVDSGVNRIAPLDGLLLPQEHLGVFEDGDDEIDGRPNRQSNWAVTYSLFCTIKFVKR